MPLSKCEHNGKAELSQETLKSIGLNFDVLYSSAENIVAAAIAVKNKNKREYTTVPFCHTIEANALGADIFPGDDTAGPRPASYIYQNIEDVKLYPIKESALILRLAEACIELKRRRERITWMIAGPISVLSCLLPLSALFKTWRKDTDNISALFGNFSKIMLEYTEQICAAGASCVSYADPAGIPAILGEKYSTFLSENFTSPFLEKVEKICGTNTHLIICPLTKTTLQNCTYKCIWQSNSE